MRDGYATVFGVVVDAAARRAGVRQDHVARYVGVSQSSVSRWMHGTASPTLEQAHALATCLGTTATALHVETLAVLDRADALAREVGADMTWTTNREALAGLALFCAAIHPRTVAVRAVETGRCDRD